MKVYPTHIEHFSYISCISPTLNVACCYTRLKHDKCLLLHKHLTWYSSWGSCDEWLFYRLGRHCLLASAWQCSFYKLWTNQSTNKPNKHHFAKAYTLLYHESWNVIISVVHMMQVVKGKSDSVSFPRFLDRGLCRSLRKCWFQIQINSSTKPLL